MTELEALKTVKTRLPPCCLRITESGLILVGTYHLDKESGNRTGSLDLFDDSLQLLTSEETYGAVLDLKLSPFDHELVASAHSTGNVMMWRIAAPESDKAAHLELLGNLQIFEVETLITSLHFSPLDASIILVTNTVGQAATISISKGGVTFSCKAVKEDFSKTELIPVEVQGHAQRATVKQPAGFPEPHALECWTGEFGSLQPLQNVVFTGGDDASIMAHDLRCKDLIWSNSRIHEAGVVGIKCSTSNFRNSSPTSIITGSYDDHMRVLELRMLGDSIYPGRNTPATKVWNQNLGGGVWRFVEQPQSLRNTSKADQLLVCCMYNGAKVITIDDHKQGDILSESYYIKKGHESMCYGGDWCKDFAVTCSFYDNSLQRWNPSASV